MAKKKKEARRYCDCMLCGHRTKSANGTYYHIKVKHPERRMVLGKTWEHGPKITKAGLKPKTKAKAKKEKKPKKSPPRTATPNMQYIEVPAIIRIPISMGPIQIVSIGD